MNPYERLDKVKSKINEHRQGFIQAVNFQVSEILFYSLEGEEPAHTNAMEELETALTLLWRFDRKLQEAQSLEALLESLNAIDSNEGPTG